MQIDEVHFWRKQLEAGRLTESLDAYQERAIQLFGPAAVQGKDEAEIYRTLEAYELLILPDHEILKILNRVPESLLEEIERFPADVGMEIKKLSRHTSDHVEIARGQAREHLNRVFPK